jgi:hypothetical protein
VAWDKEVADKKAAEFAASLRPDMTALEVAKQMTELVSECGWKRLARAVAALAKPAEKPAE